MDGPDKGECVGQLLLEPARIFSNTPTSRNHSTDTSLPSDVDDVNMRIIANLGYKAKAIDSCMAKHLETFQSHSTKMQYSRSRYSSENTIKSELKKY
ncbi:hypothetical protein Gorai_014266 [Gossypium raimondii]|uniref:Uncharacterized protein n=1 Tax=Gossypium raimondii TaxID=29730 RepID=A0A7J8P2D1_GOSRA|nr:hypothetical protein [Gossypium raimondii]